MNVLFYIILFGYIVNGFKMNTSNLAAKLITSGLILNTPLSPTLAPEQVPNSGALQKAYIEVQNNEIYFYGGLNSDSAKALKDSLKYAINNGKSFMTSFPDMDVPPIKLHIQSYGGSLLDTLYIVDIIKGSPIPIYTYVDGYVASAATLISVVGKKRYMSENSLMLIHQITTGGGGKYSELEDESKNNLLLMNMIKAIYYKHTNISPMDLDEILKHDIWFDSDKCKKLGLVDEITNLM